MKGIISLVLILGTIGSLQHFDLIWVMTEGGPARATTTFSIEVYRNAFKYYNMGFAAAVGTVWAVLLGCFSFVYLRRVQEGGE
jgi:multiple sugar transport system permease protein